ncbi:MAG: hypothetical protein K5985_00610 [Lachnospiraceae bacterium]|nr:hypothetical protein [Lachnospiraceae bacterium]
MKKLRGIVKRIAAVGLAAMLVISQADVSVLADDSDTMSFAELQALIDGAANGDTVKLEKDVNWKESYPSASGDDSNPLIIPSDKTVTLDLNGHTIDRGLQNDEYYSKENGNVIKVSGNLTLTDSSANSTGKLTGGNISSLGGGGGGVFIDENGKFTMEGGSITDCAANSGGGGVKVNGGTFTMNGGTISSCTDRNGFGGGVCVYSGTFTMNGSARITGCTATQGIDNAQGGGGVYLYGGTFNVSGSPVIIGNTAALPSRSRISRSSPSQPPTSSLKAQSLKRPRLRSMIRTGIS